MQSVPMACGSSLWPPPWVASFPAFSPEAEGHRIDTGVKAFHHSGGFIRAGVLPLKLLASAITIGSGGAAGQAV
jgi:H+/Cl- antiporter ClcA